MSHELPDRVLPDIVKELFDAKRSSEHFGLAYELVTVDEDGRPRIAMLSHGEILAVDAERLRFALWATTTTGKNLAAGRPCMLSVVTPGLVCYLAGTARKVSSTKRIDVFELDLDVVRIDEHKGLPVTAPITFESEDDETTKTVLTEWRQQIEAMQSP